MGIRGQVQKGMPCHGTHEESDTARSFWSIPKYKSPSPLSNKHLLSDSLCTMSESRFYSWNFGLLWLLYFLLAVAVKSWIEILIVTYKTNLFSKDKQEQKCVTFSKGHFFWKSEANYLVENMDLKVGFGNIGAAVLVLTREFWSSGEKLWWSESKNYGCYFQSFQKLKAGFTVPGARPASGQCEATLGVLRWPHVCVEIILCKLMDFTIGQLFNRPGFWTDDMWWRHWGWKRKSERAGLFWTFFSSSSFSTFIHLIYTCLLSSYYVSDAVIRAGVEWSMKTSLPWDLVPGGEGVHLWTKEWESSTPSWDRAFLVFLQQPMDFSNWTFSWLEGFT